MVQEFLHVPHIKDADYRWGWQLQLTVNGSGQMIRRGDEKPESTSPRCYAFLFLVNCKVTHVYCFGFGMRYPFLEILWYFVVNVWIWHAILFLGYRIVVL